MQTLERLQSVFQDDVLTGQLQLVSVLGRQGKVSPSQGIEIYQNAYRLRLIETLKDTFEHTAVYLGDSWFESACLDYIQSHPSEHHNIGFFGQQFPDFLHAHYPKDPDIGELALLDWRLRRAFDGPDEQALELGVLADLSQSDCEYLIFRFIPTLRCDPLQSNAVAIWQAINAEQPPPQASFFSEPVFLLTWRKEFQPHFRTLDAAEFSVLDMAMKQLPFAQLCQQIAIDYPDTDTSTLVGGCLREWFEQGTVSGVDADQLERPGH